MNDLMTRMRWPFIYTRQDDGFVYVLPTQMDCIELERREAASHIEALEAALRAARAALVPFSKMALVPGMGNNECVAIPRFDGGKKIFTRHVVAARSAYAEIEKVLGKVLEKQK